MAVNGFEILKPMVNTPGDIWSDRHAYQSSDANAYQSNNSKYRREGFHSITDKEFCAA